MAKFLLHEHACGYVVLDTAIMVKVVGYSHSAVVFEQMTRALQRVALPTRMKSAHFSFLPTLEQSCSMWI